MPPAEEMQRRRVERLDAERQAVDPGRGKPGKTLGLRRIRISLERDLESGSLPADDWGGSDTNVEARGYWEQVWRRFKRDKVAIGGGVAIIFLVLLCFVGGPVFARLPIIRVAAG